MFNLFEIKHFILVPSGLRVLQCMSQLPVRHEELWAVVG
jgi:hypothetical protein